LMMTAMAGIPYGADTQRASAVKGPSARPPISPSSLRFWAHGVEALTLTPTS